MHKISQQKISQTLSINKDVAFAYIFGSAAGKKVIKQDSDLDMAVYFFKEPDLDQIHELMKSIEKEIGEDVVDLLVLNGCEDFILRHEVLKGDLIFCRDVELHASFFSWTSRMYEDQKFRMERVYR